MMGSRNCMMDCVVRRHSMSQLSMSRVTGLDDLRGRPHLSRWFAPGVSATRSLLGSDDIRGEGSAIADPVAVSEVSSSFPVSFGVAIPILCATLNICNRTISLNTIFNDLCIGWAATPPVDSLSSEGRGGATSCSFSCAQEPSFSGIQGRQDTSCTDLRKC